MALPVCGVRSLTQEDLEQVRGWRNQERIRNNMYTSEPISPAQQQSWFAGLEGDASRHYSLFVQDEKPIGCLYYTAIHDGNAQLGYYLGEERIWPGTGLLLELVALDYAFERLGLTTLWAEVLEFNKGPRKIHDFFGFERIGTRPGATFRDGKPIAAVRFRYERESWCVQRTKISTQLPKQVREAAALLHY